MIWAATWQNQQSDFAPSEDSDQPGHPPSLISVFAVCLMRSQGPKLSSCGQQRLSNWADVQADLSLHWSHTHFVGFVILRLIYDQWFQWLHWNVPSSHIHVLFKKRERRIKYLKPVCSGSASTWSPYPTKIQTRSMFQHILKHSYLYQLTIQICRKLMMIMFQFRPKVRSEDSKQDSPSGLSDIPLWECGRRNMTDRQWTTAIIL